MIFVSEEMLKKERKKVAMSRYDITLHKKGKKVEEETVTTGEANELILMSISAISHEILRCISLLQILQMSRGCLSE